MSSVRLIGAGCRLVCFAVAGLLLTASASQAQQTARQVLLLQSVDRGQLTLDQFTGNFRGALAQRSGQTVSGGRVVVGAGGPGGASDPAIRDCIPSMFAGHPGPARSFTGGGSAAVFAR